MKNYDVKGLFLEGKKAVIAVALPKPLENNSYTIFDIYNISDQKENKIVIHFKDSLGKPLESKGNFVPFIIDFSNHNCHSVNFTKPINVAFHHQNDKLTKTIQEIYDSVFGPIITPDTTGKGTIREIE